MGCLSHIFKKALINLRARGPIPRQPVAKDHGTRCAFGAREPGTKVTGTDASDCTGLATRR